MSARTVSSLHGFDVVASVAISAIVIVVVVFALSFGFKFSIAASRAPRATAIDAGGAG